MAFAKFRQARLPLYPVLAESLTMLQNSLSAADRAFDPPRFDPDISTQTGGFPTRLWRLFGPDLHRLAHRELVARLRDNHSFVFVATELLDAPENGLEILRCAFHNSTT